MLTKLSMTKLNKLKQQANDKINSDSLIVRTKAVRDITVINKELRRRMNDEKLLNQK